MTVAYSFGDIGNFLIRVALLAFGTLYTFPSLVVAYSDDGGFWQFIADLIDSLSYCIQPLAGQDIRSSL